MNIDEHPCPAFFWESEFHEHNDTDIAIIGTLAIPYIYRCILVWIKKRKIAKIKECKCCWKIQVECPF